MRQGYSCGVFKQRDGRWVIKVAAGYLVCEPNLKFRTVLYPDAATPFETFTQASSTAALVQRITSKAVTIEPLERST